ncbi:MAG: serine hydrolase [Bacteroidota bacterium]|nr:serine hydrolase [Bacteroidota bacterium]
MKKTNRVISRLLFTTLLLAGFISIVAQTISSGEIDSLVEKTMKTFDVPGIAVAVVKDDKVIHSRGYGVRSLNTKLKVDENTLFAIASNSKAFTSAALGILVDEKKLSWDDKVIDYIPEFRLYSPYVTEEFRIRDLLTHRSGLGLGAGDLMIWPGLNDFTLKDIIHNLRYLKPVSSFRTKYDYDNLMFIVAGEVVARASGMRWEDFVETRIMKPLNMTASAAAYSRLKDKSNVIDPHAPVNGVVQVIDRDFNFNEVGNAAGGIYSNITDMCKWIIMQMNDGRYGEGLKNRLFSEEVHREMWSPQTIIKVTNPTAYNTHFSSYGLGWFLSDVKGYKQVGHTGGLAGIVTQVTLIPELKLGIIVFTNQQSGAAFNAISNTIKDRYFGIKGIDRVKQYRESETGAQNNAKKVTDEIWKNIGAQQKNASISVNDTLFTGTYSDNWFGDAIISVKNGNLWFDSKRSMKLTGEMFAYKGTTFIVKWNDRSMDADAYVMFCLDKTGKASGIKMEAISPLTDFSYDFQDLDFSRAK